MMKGITKGWNVVRLIRLVLGVAILVQGMIANNITSILVGAILGGMTVANVGCCGANGCSVNTTHHNKSSKVKHEKLDSKQ